MSVLTYNVDSINICVNGKVERYVKERKGKWINHRTDDGHHIADCSICGNTLQWFDDEGGHLFCPNCGARMVNEE